MVRYIGKRLLQIIPIFFVVSVLIFALVRMSPTEPITVILGGKQSTQAAVQAAQEKFHLNEPIVKQYFRWMIGMFHGDFGQSYKFQQSVGSMITERIPVTLGLVGFSSIIGIAIAIPAGVLCAVKKNTYAAEKFPRTLEELKEYDAVFLSDIGSNTLLITNQCFAEGKTDSNRCQIIKKYVEEGGSLCMIGGYMSFTGIDGTARYGQTEIADVLPVEMLDIDDRVEAPQGLVPELIEEHEAVSGLEGEWPYLLGYNKTITKSDAKTLVKIGEDPLIAIGEYGKGKSAVFTSDCSPHWGSPAFVEWEKYDLLWKDLLDWMTK